MPYKDPERAKAQQRRRYAESAEIRANKKAYRERNLAHSRAQILRASLLRRYGITPEERAFMKAAQNGACAICGDVVERLCIDHDHETTKVRGLLCIQCNTGLAYIEDAAWFTLALEYLRRPPNQV